MLIHILRAVKLTNIVPLSIPTYQRLLYIPNQKSRTEFILLIRGYEHPIYIYICL